jgi:uncharacterized membrane protein YeaQ/YmgE (transglycosylase-associated protein family)
MIPTSILRVWFFGLFSFVPCAYMHTHLGFMGTTLLGIVGSIIGGLIADCSRAPEGFKFQPAGFLMSIISAIVLVFLTRLVG